MFVEIRDTLFVQTRNKINNYSSFYKDILLEFKKIVWNCKRLFNIYIYICILLVIFQYK